MTLPISWAVFPLWGHAGGRCACGNARCKRIGKHPATLWSKVAEGQQMDIPPGYGVGVCTGHRSGIIVLDFDTEGAYEEMAPRLPATFSVATGRGVHLYFRDPGGVKCSAGKLAPGVDVRGDGGFVCGPGTVHKSGAVYEVVDDRDPVDAPEWLLDELTADGPSTHVVTDNAPLPCEGGELARREVLAIAWLKEAPCAVEGEGGSLALWNVALKLVRRYELPLERCTDLINDYYNPRCVPEWTNAEIFHKLEDARDKSDMPTGIAPEGFGVDKTAPSAAPSDGYTHSPGYNATAQECKKKDTNTLIGVLRFHPEWTGVLRYDTYRRRPVAVKPPVRLDLENNGITNADITRVVSWFDCNGATVGNDQCGRVIEIACAENPFHPVKEYLASCSGDSSVFDALAKEGLGSDNPRAGDILRKFLVGAVRRVLKPGCQMDTMLVLVGPQGSRKTSFVRSLFGEFTRSQMPDLASKDASQALTGFWGIELAELDRILRAESSTVKEFLTRTFDDYRPPYGRAELRFARECVFVGTVNDDTFLRDSTGARRFWPLGVEDTIDTQWVEAHRDEIWGAARIAEAAGESHWYDNEAPLDEMREQYQKLDAWHEKIEGYLVGKDWVRLTDIFITAIGGKLGDADTDTDRRITGTLKRLGWKRKQKRLDGRNVKVWVNSQVPGVDNCSLNR
jgi:predicted P-loop ATPase